MPEEHARVLARSGNIAVTQLSGRAFPGLHVQGDTFAATYHALLLATAHLRTAGTTVEDLDYTLAEIRSMLDFYEETLAANGISLPYARPAP
ncbi:DUF6959 family protein [Dactylosporangium sp. CA-139066]|uniref:DUF6959 family protein n=1 Tax=Dactylosporangium sp. CA-139066 TaxID=3239930 RepID=UPI003D912C44